MATIDLRSQAGTSVGAVELPEAVFGAEASKRAVRQAVNAYLGNQRLGTAKTKTRAEVSGGGRKPWAQKGTGRARQGSTRANQWVGGATAFGPMVRSYRTKVNRKARRLAICSVLSARAEEGAVAVVESLDFPGIKTKQIVSFLQALNLDGKVLIVAPRADRSLVLSARNLPGVEVTIPENLNVYDLLNAQQIVFSRESVELVGRIYSAPIRGAKEESEG